MKVISKIIYASVFSLVIPAILPACLPSAYASLVDTSQNQAFESKPSFAGLELESPKPLKFFTKVANVKFIVGGANNGLEFSTDDLCRQAGYPYKGCTSGYVKGEACPYNDKFVRECIDPAVWCQKNGYNVTSCIVPKYLTTVCPHSSVYYKSCETDNIRACKELGYSLTCEAGKIGDTAQACPYNPSYKKCVCNPCSGFAYTSQQANAQGYTPGEVCNSCGTIKYKRNENKCEGYKNCDCGGETGAKVCYAGTIKKFDTCKSCCENKCNLASCPNGNICEYESCSKKYCVIGCATGYSDLDNYWCQSALRCWVK